jgi:hypothetical protein
MLTPEAPLIDTTIIELTRKVEEVLEETARKSERLQGLVAAARHVVKHADTLQGCFYCRRYWHHAQDCPIGELERRLTQFDAAADDALRNRATRS